MKGNENFEMPRKFSFDEFYEMLREFVNDPRVRDLLATYDAEDAEGRGDLLDGSQCSDLAYKSHSDFQMAGWKLLSARGWPTYADVMRSSDLTRRDDLARSGDTLWHLGRRLIRKGPNQSGWDFQDEEFDVEDRESVFRLLTFYEEKYSKPMPFQLSGEV